MRCLVYLTFHLLPVSTYEYVPYSTYAKSATMVVI